MKKLFSENPSTGFEGNVLTEDSFNEIIESLTMSENYTVTQAGNVLTFNNGIRVEMTDFDTDGDFTRVVIDSTLTTDRSPLYSNPEKTVYSHPEIINVDTASAYTLLTPEGVPVPKVEFTLNAAGQFTFSAPRSENYFMVSGLSYTLKNEILLQEIQQVKK